MSTLIAFIFGFGVLRVYTAYGAPKRTKSPDAWTPKARAWLLTAGIPATTPLQFVAMCGASGLGTGLVTAFALGSPTIALVAFAGGSYIPLAWARSRRRSRRSGFQACWPEAIDLLSGAVRSGDTLPAAVAVVAERGPELLRPSFRALCADHMVSGDFVGALERMGDALADPTADRVVVTLSVAHRIGGKELGRVLRTLGNFLREDLAVRREIEARQSWTLVAARVAAGAPWLVLLMVASRPQSLQAYNSFAGFMVVAGGAITTFVGYRIMVALGKLPEEPRVLGARTAVES